MPLVLYNTLTKRLEPFESLEPGVVRMYNCGPTVYSDPHIGNFRAFLFADVLRRALELFGNRVDQVMNLTDVGHLTQDDVEAGEDKIEAAARRQQRRPEEIADHYAGEFFALSRLLNLRPALKNPKAREHIPEMLALIRVLVERGYAYAVNGNVYYDVARFPGYGRLSGNSLEELQAGARIEVNPEKRSPLDFALWKQDPKHLMQWDSPWGRGFPGWHIECSAMSMKYLGEQLDIHTGGEDNIFPHHECEIAQSEAVTGKPFARFWLHTRHLLVDGKKMSKSLGNFHAVRDVLARGFDPRVLRFALVRAHYRQPLNFTFEGMEAARETLGRLRDFRRRVAEMTSAFAPPGASASAPELARRSAEREGGEREGGEREGGELRRDKTAGLPSASAPVGASPVAAEVDVLLAKAEAGFRAGLEDDLNVSAALAALFDLVSGVNRLGALPRDGAGRVAAFLDRADGVLGVLEATADGGEALDPELQALVAEREAARKRRDFAESDRLRKVLRERGIIVEDTPRGPVWKRAL